MKIRPWAKISAAVILGVGISLAVPTLAAVGQGSGPTMGTSTIHIGADGTLLARGVAAKISLTVTCPVGEDGNLNVQVAERSGKMILQSSTGQSIACKGTVQSAKVSVLADGRPWTPGSAFVQASINGCSEFGCTTNTTSRAVQLENGS